MAVPVTVVGGELESGQPRELVQLRPPFVSYLRNSYDPTPDGRAVIAFNETGLANQVVRVRTGWRVR